MFEYAQHIDDYHAAVEAEGSEYFKFYDRGTYVVGNYISILAKFGCIFEKGISDEQRRNRILLRDMRGIIFGPDGIVISKPLQKFHNLNETLDNQYEALPWSEGYSVYSKLDGSMIRPVWIDGSIRFCTKAGITHMTPDVEVFVQKNPQYYSFAQWAISAGITPIFEYMAPKHRIVVDYGPEEKMTLLKMRYTWSGQYVPYFDMLQIAAEYDIPVVDMWEDNGSDIRDRVETLVNAEGVVIEFANGHCVKLKNSDYLNLHKSREMLERERFVSMMTLTESIDDMLPLVPEYIRPRLEEYARDFLQAYLTKRDEIRLKVLTAIKEAQNNIIEPNERKAFALNNTIPSWIKSIGFKLMDLINVQTDIEDEFNLRFKDLIIKYANSSDIKFETDVRNNIFEGKLPEWNIWNSTTP